MRQGSHQTADEAGAGQYGRPYHPREWYCVPYEVIDQTIQMISSGEIIDYYYDEIEQELKKK